ncbi:hypothetical protein [Brachybacterium sp. GPGPB12]|uniref:hypothetical protein n=1 Tax=Brachybacterium sp. GPGPB12 TaxID=3023517 RepID=UPI0031346430
MASLIDSVRKPHGPALVDHDENGFDVDVICEECTRLRTEALSQATGDGEEWGFSAETARVPYPCPTRVVAGTLEVEGKDEAARLRLDRLVVRRDELEERMERLDAVIGLIRRDLGEETAAADEASAEGPEDDPSPARKARQQKKSASAEKSAPPAPDDEDAPDDEPGYDF